MRPNECSLNNNYECITDDVACGRQAMQPAALARLSTLLHMQIQQLRHGRRLESRRHIKNSTPSIDAYFVEEQSTKFLLHPM